MFLMPTRDYWPSATPLPQEVELSVEVFGNKFNNAIVRYLASVEHAQLSDLLKETGIARATLGIHLRQLEDWGVIAGDLPRGERRGKSVYYKVDRERVKALLKEHLQFLIGSD